MYAEYRSLARRWDYIRFLAGKERRSAFVGAVLGNLWLLLLPASQVLVYYFLIVVLFRRGETYGQDPLAFLCVGLFHYAFIADGLNAAAASIMQRERLLLHVAIEPMLFVATSVYKAAAVASVPVALGLLVYAARGGELSLRLAWYPLVVASMVLFVWVHGLPLACLTVWLRDIRHLLGIALRVLIYLAPVIYSASLVPDSLRGWYFANPLACLFGLLEYSLFGQALPPPVAVVWLYGEMALMLVAGHALYRFCRPRLTKWF